MSEKITNIDDIRKALRLFFFHEVLHSELHEMGDGKHENIGSFPKVLEIADYQADVYAILNEYGFQRFGTNKIENPKRLFILNYIVSSEVGNVIIQRFAYEIYVFNDVEQHENVGENYESKMVDLRVQPKVEDLMFGEMSKMIVNPVTRYR